MPAKPMSRATWSRPTSWPARRAAFQSLRTPYTRKFSVHSSTRAGISMASRTARAESGRDFAA